MTRLGSGQLIYPGAGRLCLVGYLQHQCRHVSHGEGRFSRRGRIAGFLHGMLEGITRLVFKQPRETD